LISVTGNLSGGKMKNIIAGITGMFGRGEVIA
jgi:hypothetical protein